MANNVIFKVGTRDLYNALEQKDTNTLYWLTDVKEIRKGEDLFGVGREATQTDAGLLSAADKTKLDNLSAGTAIDFTPVDATIVIADGESGGKTIGVQVSKEADNALELKADGLFVAPAEIGDLGDTIASMQESLATLTGEGAGSVTKIAEDAATAAIDDFANKVSDDGVVNTMKELVDYVAEHGPEAAEMAGNISTLQNVINSLPDEFMSEITEVSRTETTNVAKIRLSIKQEDGTYSTAQEHGVPILRTNEFTSTIMSAIVAFLKVNLAPRVTLHGVLIEIYGEGVLLLGDSGVGKSETAIELVKRGHRLIADDAVEIKRVSDKTLVGTAPEVIRHFIELRGIGIVDVRRIFGIGAIKMTEKVELVINLEPWEDGKQYDRLGMDSQTTSILDIAVPSLTIPVKPGRNLAVIIEVAAMNDRQKKMGFNAAKELQERMLKQYGN